jgi:hypothetical protein
MVDISYKIQRDDGQYGHKGKEIQGQNLLLSSYKSIIFYSQYYARESFPAHRESKRMA